MKKKNDLKMFVVRKFIMARDVKHALKLSKDSIPDDVYIDTEWKEAATRQLTSAIGFDNGYFLE